jgi:hypothetical protein
MSALPLPPIILPSTPSPAPVVRVEYVDFRDVEPNREFRFRVRGLDGPTDLCLRVPIAAFVPGRIRLQDGPDVCYQIVLRMVAAGEAAGGETITIDEADLARYAEAHTNAPKHRSWSLASPTVDVANAEQVAPPVLARRAAPAVAVPEPVLQGGQRINHAVFGLGVMSAPTGIHTIIHFDQDGSKRFVTTMLAVDLLSAPQVWETSVRGKNRPRS